MKIPNNPQRTRSLRFLIYIPFCLLLSSCYSIRISNIKGCGQPDPMNNSDGFYRGLEVHELDTVIKVKIPDNDVMVLKKCPEGCFHSVEYRVTFGDVLRSGLTLGKRRKVRIKYVCLKERND
jgi:hypothetical protein